MELFPFVQKASPFIKQLACVFAFAVWEYWLGKTKKLAAASTLELILRKVFFKPKKEELAMQNEIQPAMSAQPDKEIKLGEIGEIEIDFTSGLAMISLSAKVPGNIGIEGGAFIKCDAEQLINKLFEAIEKKLPDSVDPLAETVKMVIIGAVKAIK